MLENCYDVSSTTSHDRFEFISRGPKGEIRKAVKFTEITKGIFNIAFGDVQADTNEISDSTRPNNGDREMILNTVAAIVLAFLESKGDAIVFAQGATPAKTRLYQMSLNANMPDINQKLVIIGFRDNMWEKFDSTKNYEALAAQLKRTE